jgi:hypothetical protein
VGAGSSQEAPFDLLASVPAGTWHLILDCIIIEPVTTTFDMIWRRPGGSDTVLFEFTESYVPLGGGQYAAQKEEYDQTSTIPIDFVAGDQLVFKYTGNGSSDPDTYEPNGDGPGSNMARIPAFTLPQ